MAERLPKWLRQAYELLAATLKEGGEHELDLFAPAMAYALIVSLAPLTLALNSFGALSLRDYQLLPESPLAGAKLTAEQVLGGAFGWAGPLGSVVAFVLVAWGASALFRQFVEAISRIWRQGPPLGGIKGFLRGHLFAFLLLGVAGIGLFASAIIGSALSGLTRLLEQLTRSTGLELTFVTVVLNGRPLLDFAFAAVLFTVSFATVPPVRPRVADVVPGALFTAAAYALGQLGLGLYLRQSARLDALGAFGAFLGFVVWSYYTALIVLWGAEFAYQWARRRACARGGDDVVPYECDTFPRMGDTAARPT